jgi:hypothetical protein
MEGEDDGKDDDEDIPEDEILNQVRIRKKIRACEKEICSFLLDDCSIGK